MLMASEGTLPWVIRAGIPTAKCRTLVLPGRCKTALLIVRRDRPVNTTKCSHHSRQTFLQMLQMLQNAAKPSKARGSEWGRVGNARR